MQPTMARISTLETEEAPEFETFPDSTTRDFAKALDTAWLKTRDSNFVEIKTHGTLKTPAKFKALWKSGSLVPPSPTNPTVIARSRRILAAHAAPTAWGICVAMQLDHVGLGFRSPQ